MKLERIENCRLAYMRRVGPYGVENFKLMESLKEWAANNNLFNNNAVIYGIAQDNPHITALQSCRYDVCITISNDYKIDKAVKEMELEGGTYVVYKINHTTEDIQKSWSEIFDDLEEKGDKIDNKPILERYSKVMTDNGSCEICVPIQNTI